MQTKKILLVDDDRLMLKYLTDLLEREGHEVASAQDGFAALNMLTSFFPDIMLAEIRRVLKPGGSFVGSVPLENRIDSPSHIVYYTLSGINNLLSDYFRIEELLTMKSRPTNKSENLIVWMAQKP